MFPYSTLTPDLLQIEKKIAPLVKLINDIGLPTYYSCEGHGKNRGSIQFPYPMVVITPNNSTEQAVAFMCFVGVLGVYNSCLSSDYRVSWVLFSNGNHSKEIVLRPDRPEDYSLNELHKNLKYLVSILRKIKKWYKK